MAFRRSGVRLPLAPPMTGFAPAPPQLRRHVRRDSPTINGSCQPCAFHCPHFALLAPWRLPLRASSSSRRRLARRLARRSRLARRWLERRRLARRWLERRRLARRGLLLAWRGLHRRGPACLHPAPGLLCAASRLLSAASIMRRPMAMPIPDTDLAPNRSAASNAATRSR